MAAVSFPRHIVRVGDNRQLFTVLPFALPPLVVFLILLFLVSPEVSSAWCVDTACMAPLDTPAEAQFALN